jgi:DeoR/GlpR family transcriptional regulator of sugar metabolism
MAAHSTRKQSAAARQQTIARNVARQVKQGRNVATRAGHTRAQRNR